MTPMLASLLNLAGPDMIVVLLIVLLLFGSKKLPELARGMGRAVAVNSAPLETRSKKASVSRSPASRHPDRANGASLPE